MKTCRSGFSPAQRRNSWTRAIRTHRCGASRRRETSTNSIYVRFQDKEGLFSAIVEPVLSEMLRRFLLIQEDFYRMDPAAQSAHMTEYVDGGTMELVDYMYDHLDEFRLLLDASYGTRFHHFADELVRIEVEYTYRYMAETGSRPAWATP